MGRGAKQRRRARGATRQFASPPPGYRVGPGPVSFSWPETTRRLTWDELSPEAQAIALEFKRELAQLRDSERAQALEPLRIWGPGYTTWDTEPVIDELSDEEVEDLIRRLERRYD